MTGETPRGERPTPPPAGEVAALRRLTWGLARLRDAGTTLLMAPVLAAIGMSFNNIERSAVFVLITVTGGLVMFVILAVAGVGVSFIGIARLSRQPIGAVAARYFRSALVWAGLAIAGAGALFATSTPRDTLLAAAPVVLVAPLALLGTGLALRAMARDRGDHDAEWHAGRGLRWLWLASAVSLLAWSGMTAYYLTAPARKQAGIPGRLAGLGALMLILSRLPIARFHDAAQRLAANADGGRRSAGEK